MKNPVYAVNCKKCGKLLFGLKPIDDADPNSPKAILGTPDFRQTAEGNYFVCPHCQAKNMTVTIGDDPPQTRITDAI